MTQNKSITLSKFEKYILDKFDVTFVKKWLTVALKRFNRYDEYLLKRQLQAKIDTAVAKVTDKSTKDLYNAVLTNQLNYCIQSLSFGEKNVQVILLEMDIAVNSVGAYAALSNFVGVQPMQGPVGLVYTMQYQENKESKRTELTVKSNAIEAGSRRLQSSFTHEAMQDLSSMNSLDLASELAKIIGTQVGEEYISELIEYMIKANELTTVEPTTPGVLGLNNLIFEINKRSNDIAIKTKRSSANFLITSPSVVSMLQCARASKFEPAMQSHTNFEFGYAVKYCGKLNGTIDVYCSMAAPIINDSIVLLGYKGSHAETDAGLILAPYVPVMASGVVTNPKTFQAQTNLMTRYGLCAMSAQNPESETGNLSQYKNYYSAFSAKAFEENLMVGAETILLG